ncbi:MAG TPA: hypothetical protein VLI90_03455, partial [Tepidisphaeraceae bacterium]|nr:hypothetical protein [Tepidisphaeraceae bacterium]
MALLISNAAAVPAVDGGRANLAPVATPSSSFVSGHESLATINDGFEPRNSGDHRHGCYGNWPEHGTQWIQYEWSQPISTDGVDVYWWDDHQGVRLPKAARVLYWNGSAFVPVSAMLGVEHDRYNSAA